MKLPRWAMHCLAVFIVFIGLRTLYLLILAMVANHSLLNISFGIFCCMFTIAVVSWIIYDNGIWNKKKK